MTFSTKIKTIDNKIKQNKAQYAAKNNIKDQSKFMNSIKRKDKPVTKEKDKKKPTLKKYKKTFLILFYQDLTKLSSVKSNKEHTHTHKK